MTAHTSPTPQRVRIHSHLTQSRFLHVEDALGIGKLRLFAGCYRQGTGMGNHAHAFVDIADARVLFGALAAGEPGFSHREYKGTPPRGERGAMSRVLSVAVKGDKVYIELKSGPGKLTSTGTVTPNGRAEVEVTVVFSLYEARRLGAAVLAYLRAWDVVRMSAHSREVGRPGGYTLIDAGNDTTTRSAPPADRPVTRKGTATDAGPVLVYGDGRSVDAQNRTEVATFRRYVAERQAAPGSKADLLAYFQQRVQAAA